MRLLRKPVGSLPAAIGCLTCLLAGAAWVPCPAALVQDEKTRAIADRERFESGLSTVQQAIAPDQEQREDRARYHRFELEMCDSDRVSEYWIGAKCRPISELVRTHLSLEHGLEVCKVVDGSPASQAGLKRLDIITLFGDRPLTRIKDLVQAIESSAINPTRLQIVRNGDIRYLEITPQRRPRPERIPILLVADEQGDFDWEQARLEFQQKVGSVKPGELPPVVELILISPSFAEPLLKVVPAARFPNNERLDDFVLGNAEHVGARHVDAEQGGTKENGAAIFRLREQLLRQLAELQQVNESLAAEQTHFCDRFEQMMADQTRLGKLVEWQLEQIEDHPQPEFLAEVARQSESLDQTLATWKQFCQGYSKLDPPAGCDEASGRCHDER